MTRKLYFTVDADRDANIPIPGSVAAGSIDRGSGTGPRFSSSERGMSVLAELLDDIGIRGTFFMEGRTAEVTGCSVLSGHCIGLHGYDHEDLLGRETGIVPDVEDVLRRGYDAVSDVLSRPTCFRAPYMAADDRVLETVRSLGIRADSSFYTDVGGPTDPYELQGMTEFPVPKARDAGGKVIAAYLWPMHEGRRVPEDYTRMADGLDTLVLATHTWHMVETREGGAMDADWVGDNADAVRRVVEGILDMGFEADVIGRFRESRPCTAEGTRSRPSHGRP